MLLNQIVHGNAFDVLKPYPDNFFNLVLTDPPYGTGTYETDQHVSNELWQEIRRVGTNLFALFGYPACHYRWAKHFEDLKLVGQIAWYHYNTILVSSGLTRVHQDIAIWGNSTTQIHADRVREPYSDNKGLAKFHNAGTKEGFGKRVKEYAASQGKTKRDSRGRRCSDVWSIPSPNVGFNSSKRLHPNEKPEEAIKKLLLLLTEPDDIVLDPFAGSGTISAMCKQLGRQYVGIEIDDKWAKVAKARVGNTMVNLF